MRYSIIIILLITHSCNEADKTRNSKSSPQEASATMELYELGRSTYLKANHGCYMDVEGTAAAINYLERAIDGGCIKKDAYEILAQCYHNQGDKINEEKAYSLGLAQYEKEAMFYFYRGNIRKELKKFEDALSDYSRVITFDSSKSYLKDAIYYRGAMSYILGDLKSANSDMADAQRITEYELRTYYDYCRLWQ
jgi:tetratricopeptide (TPR) repeat protein